MRGREEREDLLRRALVRIVGAGHRPVGTGFFVTRSLVATCAHVAREALRKDDTDGLVALEVECRGEEWRKLREGSPKRALTYDEALAWLGA